MVIKCVTIREPLLQNNSILMVFEQSQKKNFSFNVLATLDPKHVQSQATQGYLEKKLIK